MPSGHQPPPGVTRSATATSSRAAEVLRLARSPLGVVLVLVFLIDSMTALVVIAFGNSFLIETVHAPASYPAYELGIYGFVKLVTAPAGGWILDRARTPLVIAFIYATEAAGLGITLSTGSANGFLVGVGFLSTGIALAWLLVFHALGHAADAKVRGAATAYVGLVSAGASACGFGLAALLGQLAFWEAAFLVGFALATAAAALMFRLPRRRAAPEREERADRTTGRAANSDRRRRLIAGTVIFAHFVAVTSTLAVFGPFVLRSLHLSLLRAGFYLLPAGCVAALSMLAMGRLSRQGNRLREVAALYALGALSVLLAATVHEAWLFAFVAIPLAVAMGGAQPLLNASLLDVSHSSEDTGQALGWLFFAEGLGSVAGPMLIGLVISAAGIRDAVVALGLLEALIVAVSLAGSRATRI